ncbi:Dipeptide transport system permease protein dppB [Cedecea neteri]|uniref:Dipeptide transport system permease protein dppB n=1 Tax=Cedecea neteri TaxID=158822 RepID=A0A2X2SZR6_9ENTR|nr:Dipeptide transport system permease protein dppB [Cedecea neteri]
MLRMTRASVGAVMSSSYIETALLKGLSRWRIVLSHALPNALAPIINVIAFNLAYLVVGVILVEVVFVYPGIGQLMVDAVTKRDLPVVQACGLLFGGTYILLNTTADLLAIWCNPRLATCEVGHEKYQNSHGAAVGNIGFDHHCRQFNCRAFCTLAGAAQRNGTGG